MQLRQQRTRNGLRAPHVFNGGLWQSVGGEGFLVAAVGFVKITVLTVTDYIAQEMLAVDLIAQTVTGADLIAQEIAVEDSQL